MPRRVSKEEARHLLGAVSLVTIDRWIRRGELQVEREPHGRGHRIWVLLDDGVAEAASETVPVAAPTLQATPVDTSQLLELTQLRERVRGLEELQEYHKGQMREKDSLVPQLLEELGQAQRTAEVLTRALPAGIVAEAKERPSRSWWPFWRRETPRVR